MPKPHIHTGMLFVAVAAASWGTIGVAVDVLYRVADTDALSVGFWRMAIAVPPLWLISRVFAGPGFWRVQRRDVLPLMLMGVAFAAYQVGYFAAIPLIGVAAAVLVNICSAPIIIAGLAALFLRERLTRSVGLALAAAVGGAGLLVGGSPEAANVRATVTGTLLALGAGFSYSVVALTSRFVASRYHPAQPVAVAFTLGALLLLPLLAGRGLTVEYPPVGWLLLVHLGLVPTALGYVAYLWGMRTTPAAIAAIVALLEPLISALLAVTVLGERISAAGALGGLLLLGSVAYLYVERSRAELIRS